MSDQHPSFIERKERFARKMGGKAKPTVRSENRLPPGQHLTPGFPVLDLGIRPDIPLSEWRLEVSGLVEHPRSFTWEEFIALPKFEDVSDFHCVTTWSKFDVRWTGVAFLILTRWSSIAVSHGRVMGLPAPMVQTQLTASKPLGTTAASLMRLLCGLR